MDAAIAESEVRFGGQMKTAMAEITTMLGERNIGDLSEVDTVQFMLLHTRFDDLAVEQKRFVDVDFIRRIGPPDGSEMAVE